MGAGASSLARLRKAIVIRSYNLKKPNQTIEELFKSYTFRSKNDGVLYIKLDDIRLCLGKIMEIVYIIRLLMNIVYFN